jgi:predicted DNA-binding protein (MmcQ/YjbR family)
MARRTSPGSHAIAELRARALGYPETTEDRPWGHPAFKVRGKAFLFLGEDEAELSLSLKLGAAHDLALGFPFAQPTAYGLGKSGWVTARFGPGETPPLELLLAWLDESYRLIAPKRVVAALAGGPTARPSPSAPRAPRPALTASRRAARSRPARRRSPRR